MAFHPFISGEIALQRQHDLLQRVDCHRIAKAALANRQHRARRPKPSALPAVRKARRPHRGTA